MPAAEPRPEIRWRSVLRGDGPRASGRGSVDAQAAARLARLPGFTADDAPWVIARSLPPALRDAVDHADAPVLRRLVFEAVTRLTERESSPHAAVERRSA